MAILHELAENGSGVEEIRAARSLTRRRIVITDWGTRYTDIPSLYDAHPDDSTLTLTEIRITGTGATGSGSPNEFTHARAELLYENIALAAEGETILSSDYCAEVLEVGAGRVWDGTTTDVDIPVHKVMPLEELNIEKIHTIVPEATILAALNTVNNDDWTPGGRFTAIAAGCALFLGCSKRVETDAVTGFRTRCTYKFLVRPQSHNLFWRGDTGTWAATMPLVYAESDFNSLGL